ncbi:MAG: radical SAM protein [Patescibacteria group bacterium]|nr:radical SAM protein [Patescibacteria group bacterium]MCL5261986.1 radical SAM protein [Patescibacteria group bacterium]
MKKNTLQKIEKVIAGKKKTFFERSGDAVPEVLYINLGAQCNENCNFCLIKGNEHNFPLMDLKEVKRVIKDFSEVGGEEIMLTGGEPTLRDDLPEIIDYAEKQKGLRTISVLTNAVRMADKHYAGEVFKADTKHKLVFSVSLHADNAVISDRITGLSGAYSKTFKGMQAIVKSKRRMSVYHVITNDNFRYLPRFCSFISANFPAVHSVTLAYPFPQGNAVLNKWIYVPFSLLKPFLTKALIFLNQNHYETSIAACGQFPLCIIPGFEEKVLQSLSFGEEKVAGAVGQDVFHEFEWSSKEAVDFYKNKHRDCLRCILSGYCQGFWREYIELFGFDGLKPVTARSFKGNKIRASLRNAGDVEAIISRLADGKLNAIILTDYIERYLQPLAHSLREKKIMAVIVKNDNP